jgi:probable rRNA maturation factor
MVELDLQYIDQSSEVSAEPVEEPPPRDKFQQWVNLAHIKDKSVPVQISIRIVDEDESQLLNKEYRSKDKATNVLSFAMQLPDDIINQMDIRLLGDLVICASVIAKEARQQAKDPMDHWAHMVIHGMLHLQGYDHISAADAERMESLEIKLLQKIGIDNPYLETH